MGTGCIPRHLLAQCLFNFYFFLPLYVAARVMNALIQQSLIFHCKDISLVCFSTQLLIHFPHWYSVAEQGMKEGFILGADTGTHVATCCQGWMKGLHLLQIGRKLGFSMRV